MGLNDIRDEVAEFLAEMAADSRQVPRIMNMLDQEIGLLKVSLDDRERLSHQLYDVLFLLFELAAACGTDLDSEWTQGRERKRLKYLNGHS